MFHVRKYLNEFFSNEIARGGLKSLEVAGRGVTQISSGTVFKRRKKPSLSLRIRKSFKQDENVPQDPRPLFAGVILERYPICFQDPAPYKMQHEEWSLAWNAWKYRQVPDELLNADKQNVDETSEEVRTLLNGLRKCQSDGKSSEVRPIAGEVQAGASDY